MPEHELGGLPRFPAHEAPPRGLLCPDPWALDPRSLTALDTPRHWRYINIMFVGEPLLVPSGGQAKLSPRNKFSVTVPFPPFPLFHGRGRPPDRVVTFFPSGGQAKLSPRNNFVVTEFMGVDAPRTGWTSFSPPGARGNPAPELIFLAQP